MNKVNAQNKRTEGQGLNEKHAFRFDLFFKRSVHVFLILPIRRIIRFTIWPSIGLFCTFTSHISGVPTTTGGRRGARAIRSCPSKTPKWGQHVFAPKHYVGSFLESRDFCDRRAQNAQFSKRARENTLFDPSQTQTESLIGTPLSHAEEGLAWAHFEIE